MDRKEESRLAQATTKATTGMTLTTPVHRMTAAVCTETAECRTAGTPLHCSGSYARNGSFVEGRQPYSMTRIGMEHALQIAYRTPMQYATSQAQNADIRLCHLQSAKDLYGDNSPQVEASPRRGALSESPPAMPPVLIQLDKRTASPSTPLQRARGVGTRSMAACLKASPQRKVCIFITGKKS